MSGKAETRAAFRRQVTARDRERCVACGGAGPLDAHHVIDRSAMPAGGYVVENGASLCRADCHAAAELYHVTGGRDWTPGLHPDEIFRLIGSSREEAVRASFALARPEADRRRRAAEAARPDAIGADPGALTPRGPDWRIDWAALDAACPWLHDLDQCPQDRIHHPEGDAGRHTRMVVDELVRLEGFRALDAEDRAVLFTAALLHDVAKPATYRVEEGERISARGHSRRGATLARRLLWERGVDPTARERACAIVALHQVPFFLIEKDPVEARGRVAAASQEVRLDLLAMHAEADARGRGAEDRTAMIENAQLFAEMAREEGYLDAPFAYPDARARMLHARDPAGRAPEAPGHVGDDAPTVRLMSGLPAAGKDTYAADAFPDLPKVSLDALRAELGIAPEAPQGRVVQAAKEAARGHLRAGRGFVWNATHLSRRQRAQAIDLALAYGARVEIHYVEAPRAALFARNDARAARVPRRAIEKMLANWEPPGAAEADRVVRTFQAPETRPRAGAAKEKGRS